MIIISIIIATIIKIIIAFGGGLYNIIILFNFYYHFSILLPHHHRIYITHFGDSSLIFFNTCVVGGIKKERDLYFFMKENKSNVCDVTTAILD